MDRIGIRPGYIDNGFGTVAIAVMKGVEHRQTTKNIYIVIKTLLLTGGPIPIVALFELGWIHQMSTEKGHFKLPFTSTDKIYQKIQKHYKVVAAT